MRTAEKGEEALGALGFRQFRVRFHSDLVPIEIAQDELGHAVTSTSLTYAEAKALS